MRFAVFNDGISWNFSSVKISKTETQDFPFFSGFLKFFEEALCKILQAHLLLVSLSLPNGHWLFEELCKMLLQSTIRHCCMNLK